MKSFGTAVLHPKDRTWRITAEPHVLIRLKRVFARVDKHTHGTIHLSDTAENARELAWFVERFPLEVTPREYLDERAKAHREQSERIHRVIDGSYEPRPFELALPPRDYQKVAAEATLQMGSLLLADDLGLGKTASAIAVITQPQCRPALVVTLTHLPRQWAAEIKKFAPQIRTHILKAARPYDILAAMKGRRRDAFTSALPGMDDGPDVIISNYHKLTGWSETLAGKIKAVFFDECQELRRDESGKYKAAKFIADRAEVRMGLSATPIYNYGSEIYNVLQVLSPLSLGTYEEFVREWCVLGGMGDKPGQHKIRDPKAFGTYMREQALMLRRTRAEVGRELPPLITIPYEIDCDEAPLEAIEGAAAELARIILAQGGQQAKGEKLQASEELSWRLRQATGIAKAPYVAAFARMLVEGGEKVLLAGWHREVYSIWNERLRDLNPVMFTGSESPTQKADSFTRFVRGEARVMIISLRAGAGLDGLQGSCRTVVHGELDWSPAVHEQINGRPHRDGQTEPVAAYYMHTAAGSDPTVLEVLGVKKGQIEGIRDPAGALIKPLQGGAANVKKLAESYLKQRGIAAPQPAPAPRATGTEGP